MLYPHACGYNNVSQGNKITRYILVRGGVFFIFSK